MCDRIPLDFERNIIINIPRVSRAVTVSCRPVRRSLAVGPRGGNEQRQRHRGRGSAEQRLSLRQPDPPLLR